MNYVIILSAGLGKRFKNEKNPKQFTLLNGKPLFIHSILTYLKIKEIDKILLTINNLYKNLYIKALIRYNLLNNVILVGGGITRAESIKNALSLIEHKKGVVILQNAASPYTDSTLIIKCIKEANKNGAAQAYFDVEQTIFTKKGNYLQKILKKSTLGFTMDPTVYKTNLLKKAFENEKNKIVKSETTLNIMRSMDIQVKLVKSDTSNLKITVPIDIKIAKNLRLK